MSPGDIFAAAFEAAHNGLLLLEQDSGRILEANRAFLALCGRSREQVRGMVFWQAPLVADREAGAEALAVLQAGGRLDNAELPLETRDGSLVLLEVSSHQIGSRRVQVAVRDITARQGTRVTERMAAQRLMACRAADEFAELQSALKSAATTLTECARRGESTFEQCDQVQKAAERAGLIAHELQACGGELRLRPERVQLNELIESLHLTLQRRLGPGIEVCLDLGKDIAPMIADLAQVRQILLKLAANSRDAMEHGGVFRIATRNASADDPAPAPTAAGSAPPCAYVVLTVSDNGPGLDDPSWEHLYEPFFTTKGDGKRGLGLAAVHGIVRQSGGRIWAQSEPGQGTTFRIYLPAVAREPVAGEPAAWPGRQTDGARVRTILVMEPNDGLRNVIASILKKRGYRVLPARESREALDLAQAEGAPDLLISEPETDLALRLAVLQPQLRTLFLNGHPQRAAAEGIATLAKPFELDALVGKVQQLLLPNRER